MLVGDSTVNDEGGWGTGFRASFGPPVKSINLARNGRSSKSFRDEGAWAPALAAKPNVLIQFGHNDNPGKGSKRETDPETTYRSNLTRYAGESRGAGATPIPITSIVRRNFDAGGQDQAGPECAPDRSVRDDPAQAGSAERPRMVSSIRRI